MKNLKPKIAMPKMNLGIVTGLEKMLPGFKTASYADHQRIAGILQTLATTAGQRQKIITDFFKENNLPETESIGAEHPLSRELFGLINNAETTLTKKDVANFSLEEFNISVDGLTLSFADRNFLMYWLVSSNNS
nr:hypothetical protein [uncultured Pedobacter sp.]